MTLIVPATVPVPLRAIVVGESVALLTTVTLPVKLPEVAGLKITLKVVLCPAPKVSGGVRPMVVNPTPEALIWEMVTLELLMLVRVIVCERVLLTVTLPNRRVVGVAVIGGGEPTDTAKA